MTSKKTRKSAASKKTRAASKPNALAVVRGVKRELGKRGVTVDARGRAKKNGRALSLSSLRRAVAAVKRAVATTKKSTKKPARATRPARAIAKTRTAAKPQKTVARKKPVAKKPSRTLARAMKPGRKTPARVTPPKAPPKKPARRGPTPAQVRAQKKAEAQLARARADRAKLQTKLKEQEAREKARAAELRKTQRQIAAMQKQLDALAKREERAEERVEHVAAAPPPPVEEVEAAEPTPPPARALTAEEQLAKEVEEEEAAREAERPKPKTPFDLLLDQATEKRARGQELTAAEKRELALAAAVQETPPELARAEATDQDYAIAQAYGNLTPHEQQDWARRVDAKGQPLLSEAARRIIRENAIDKAIANRSNRKVVDLRKSPIFEDDDLIKELQRALGPLVDPDRRALSNKDVRDMLVEHLRTKEKWAAYRDEINKYFDAIRPAADLVQAGLRDEESRLGRKLNSREHQEWLERFIPELKKKYPGLSERELWTMAKSPDAVAVVV